MGRCESKAGEGEKKEKEEREIMHSPRSNNSYVLDKINRSQDLQR
jgi:hypothetical protein